MSTTRSDEKDRLAPSVLRYVDGASRPVLVEEVYVDWDLRNNYWHAFEGTRTRVANWWPIQGIAWQKFGDVIAQLVSSGELVMCANTDPADHPEYHLTQGGRSRPFMWGETPLVLRYLATPAVSIAWSAKLAEWQQAADADAARRAARATLVAERVHSAVAGAAHTERALVAATGYQRDEVRSAIHALVAAGQLVYAGRSRWGSHRWRVTAEQVAPPQVGR